MKNPIEIGDLVGLKEPLIKLIEVVSSGVGNLSEPYLIKKRAEAKAHEVKVINQAIKEGKINGDVKFDGEKITFETCLIEGEIKNRAIDRLLFQEVRRQQNIENIVNIAHEDLTLVEDVSSEKVNNDWTTRFFNISQDISDEEMQIIWGKILAGEIIKPKTYSLRTLEILRNLTRNEAEIFAKTAKLAIKGDATSFILAEDDFLKQKYDIKFQDLLLLQELNFISNRELNYIIYQTKENKGILNFIFANHIIFVEKEKDAPEQNFKIFAFTKIGLELLNLIDQNFDLEYIKEFAKKLKRDNVKVKYTKIVEVKGETVSFKKADIREL